MPTKTLRFDDDVLDVLKAMRWENGGLLGVLTGGQMERKLYERTNKALEAMGGKWSRKAGGHVFTFDPREQVDGLLQNGALTVERDGFFETPVNVVKQMIALADIHKSHFVLEPSAGLGAIARAVWVIGATLDMVEKNERRAEELRKQNFGDVYCTDFLEFGFDGWQYDRIVMNPPFEELQDIDHVWHAYKLLARGGRLVSVMSESPFFRTDSKAVRFREWIDGVGGYSIELPEGSFKESGTGVRARLVVIRRILAAQTGAGE